MASLRNLFHSKILYCCWFLLVNTKTGFVGMGKVLCPTNCGGKIEKHKTKNVKCYTQYLWKEVSVLIWWYNWATNKRMTHHLPPLHLSLSPNSAVEGMNWAIWRQPLTSHQVKSRFQHEENSQNTFIGLFLISNFLTMIIPVENWPPTETNDNSRNSQI